MCDYGFGKKINCLKLVIITFESILVIITFESIFYTAVHRSIKATVHARFIIA